MKLSPKENKIRRISIKQRISRMIAPEVSKKNVRIAHLFTRTRVTSTGEYTCCNQWYFLYTFICEERKLLYRRSFLCSYKPCWLLWRNFWLFSEFHPCGGINFRFLYYCRIDVADTKEMKHVRTKKWRYFCHYFIINIFLIFPSFEFAV